MATWLSGYKKQDFGTDGGSWTRQPAIIVLHSTESGDHGWPGYSSGSSAPHFTLDPLTGECRQHISLAEAARALKNPSGGVETNRGGAVQIEIIGTCDPERKGDSGWTFLPTYTKWDSLAKVLKDISKACNIPLTEGVTWKAYPGSYGTGASQRLSGGSWNSYKGVLGHQHVPENDHGDPGNIDIAAILTAAGGSPGGGGGDSGGGGGGGTTAPAFPYPSGHYLGKESSSSYCHSGYYSSDQPNIKKWQQQMKNRGWSIGVDGLYGSESDSVCRKFQDEKNLTVDGKVGSKTWSTSWTAPIT